jgi:NAD(P)H dehydrogenase (quinone)
MAPIVIVGASGNVGSATVKALESYTKTHVRLAVRDVTKFQSLAKHFQVVYADLTDLPSLEAAFKDAGSVFIIPPSSEDRGALAINAINAAKTARVGHIVLFSIASAESKIEHLFQKQFLPVEYALRASTIPHTILRVPMFVDNNWGNAESIRTQGVFYGPIPGDIAWCPVVVSDIGEVAAKILDHPKPWRDRILRLTVPAPVSMNELAMSFSRALDKPVKYVQVTTEQAKEAFLGKGYPAWQATGVLELFKLIEAGASEINTVSPDIELVLGHPGTSVDMWVQSVKAGFM